MMDNYFQQGVAAISTGNVNEAVRCFQQAVQKKPKDAETIACLGQSLIWQGKQEQGAALLRQAGRLLAKKAKKTRCIENLIALGEQLQDCHDYQGSVKLIQQAIQIKKTDARAFQLLAQGFSRLNQNDQALAAARQARKLVPDNTSIKILLAELLARVGNKNKAKSLLEMVLHSPGLKSEQAYKVHKELAVVLDKQGEFSRAFSHLQWAAELSTELDEVNQQDLDLIPGLLTDYQKQFTSDLLSRWSVDEFQQERSAPVFLIGFLRSGTTLVQEVLAAHPNVFVADETEFIASMQAELCRITGSNETIPEQLRIIDSDIVKQLRQFYWQKVDDYYGESKENFLFVDKTTMNTINLGLINCIFPDSKVIFVLRDPRDICLSCFMQQMRLTAVTVHLSTWEGTINFYTQTMNFWLAIKNILIVDYFELRYEDAVTDFEATFKELFEYLELTWEPSVVRFHRQAAEKIISSPSYHQVSKPLYTSSLNRWHHYKDEFSAIEDKLTPLVQAFLYDAKKSMDKKF